jgi:hypothetical protein
LLPVPRWQWRADRHPPGSVRVADHCGLSLLRVVVFAIFIASMSDRCVIPVDRNGGN